MIQTICAHCKFVYWPSMSYVEPRCLHPAVEGEPEICPVTGDTKYLHEGGRMFSSKHPFCHMINEGNCPYYEQGEPTTRELMNPKET